MARSDVSDRVNDLHRCEKQLADAKDALARAKDELDAALSKRLWHRVAVVTYPGATPIYESPLHPGSSVALPEVLQAVAYEDAR